VCRRVGKRATERRHALPRGSARGIDGLVDAREVGVRVPVRNSGSRSTTSTRQRWSKLIFDEPRLRPRRHRCRQPARLPRGTRGTRSGCSRGAHRRPDPRRRSRHARRPVRPTPHDRDRPTARSPRQGPRRRTRPARLRRPHLACARPASSSPTTPAGPHPTRRGECCSDCAERPSVGTSRRRQKCRQKIRRGRSGPMKRGSGRLTFGVGPTLEAAGIPATKRARQDSNL
jgi:hypothetical protein